MDVPRSVCLYVDHWPPFYPMHGPARYTKILAHSMAGRGIDVHVLTTHPTIRTDVVENGYHVHLRQAPHFRGISRVQPGLGESFHIWKEIEALNRQYHFDVVEFTNVEGVAFVTALLGRLPTVIRANTTAFDACRLEIGNLKREKGYARLERWSAQRADAVITHTTSHLEQVAADYRLDARSIPLVPLGIVPLAPVSLTNRHPQQILAVGAASIRKGIGAFLDAAEILAGEYPQMRFVWAGKDTASAPDGRTWQQYTADARPQLRGRLTFSGPLSDEQMATLYAESTCYLCTALYESFGLTLVEAMFAGLPIVAPRTAAMAELVRHDETGRLYDPENLTDLVAQVRSIISSPNDRTRLAAAALQTANCEYTADAMTSRTLEIYRNVC